MRVRSLRGSLGYREGKCLKLKGVVMCEVILDLIELAIARLTGIVNGKFTSESETLETGRNGKKQRCRRRAKETLLTTVCQRV